MLSPWKDTSGHQIHLPRFPAPPGQQLIYTQWVLSCFSWSSWRESLHPQVCQGAWDQVWFCWWIYKSKKLSFKQQLMPRLKSTGTYQLIINCNTDYTIFNGCDVSVPIILWLYLCVVDLLPHHHQHCWCCCNFHPWNSLLLKPFKRC